MIWRNMKLMLLLTMCGTLLAAATPAVAGELKYRRTVERYEVPDVVLVNQNGTKVRFRELVQSDQPVIVDFIYGTCTTICPILSAAFVNLQKKLGPDADKVHLVSISIDPENDTPKVMKEYLRRYRAKPGWDFLTGTREDIDRVMRAFDAYIPDKMSHFALNLIRSPKDGTWVRLNGLMSTAEFMREFQQVSR
jgi:protein SCO1